ncbi:MAG TPA: hypothetical protein VMV69_26900 [Pirellulales bacterium]|nr:hypothetical protein [Pirellulales bacterium]
MDIEKQFPPLGEWLFGGEQGELGALWAWLLGICALLVASLLASWVFGTFLHGPGKAGDKIFKVISGTVSDLLHISPRRVFALARLAVKESIRKQSVVGLAVFVVILLRLAWFVDPGRSDPARVYLDEVLWWTTLLVLALSLLLSAVSLPADIQNKTIFTIVTKPVRSSEIVLGRILGFIMTGTVLLAVMGLMSYVFVVRMLDHTHDLTDGDLSAATATEGTEVGKTGVTQMARGHMHEVRLDDDGNGLTNVAQGHVHQVAAVNAGGGVSYDVGPPEGEWVARVPIYGKLTFRDRGGKPTDIGINVGNEWMYRSYIEGGSKAAATWTFQDLRREDFPRGKLILELNIRVFRTYKGRIDQGIAGRLRLVNPKNPDVYHDLGIFFAKEYVIDRHEIPMEMEHDGKKLDLFRDLAPDGELNIELSCLPAAQYFGMAKPDMYLLKREGPPWVNFAKGYFSIWLRMVLVTTFGVMFSTFLSGPVAALANLAALIGGFFVDMMMRLGTGEEIGGGAFESFIRMVQQAPMQSKLDSTVATNVGLFLDQVARGIFVVVSRLLPDFDALSTSNYVRDGYDIPANLLLIHVMMVLGFMLPALLIAFVLFKVREVAK